VNGGRRLGIGVAGLGRAFTLTLPTFVADPRVRLVGAADPRAEATARFAAEFGGRAHASVEALCADPDVEVVYVATPHELHAAHVTLAALHGKHVLVEKPMAIAQDECRAMVDAVERAGVQAVVGPSHSFDRPIARTRELVASGEFGAVRMLHAAYWTDFLYRPRRREELDAARGGGVVMSQGAHQVDVARLLVGARVTSVRAYTGHWDPARPPEGAYAALLCFEGGAFASLTYSGYGRFDGDRLCGGISELGVRKDPKDYGLARRRLAQCPTPEAEAALKAARGFGGAAQAGAAAAAHEHFGLVVVGCERADLCPTPDGIAIYRDDRVDVETLPPPRVPREGVIDELWDAVVHGKPPRHDARWGAATVEACLAIRTSAREGREIALREQAGAPR
jgi:phthalate 4,5-cis-dihydrodiol dehydrogenase